MALWIPAFARPQPAGPPISRRGSADSGGLYLLVDTNGFKWCHFDCRYRYDSKRKTLSVGTYPETGLADARKRRDTARKQYGTASTLARIARQKKLLAHAAYCFAVIAEE